MIIEYLCAGRIGGTIMKRRELGITEKNGKSPAHLRNATSAYESSYP